MTELRRRSDGGYALLAVLWISIGVVALTLAITASARSAIAASRNRIALTSATWSATACLAEARETLGRALAASAAQTTTPSNPVWDRVPQTLRQSAAFAASGCEVSARPVGIGLNVNTSDSTTLALLLTKAGMRPGRVDSIVSALLQRRPFVDLRAIHRVPGLESETGLDSLLDTDGGAIVLNHAPGPVLALLPGFTDETVRRVLEARAAGTPIQSFLELSSWLSPDAPGAAARLPGVALFQPTAWQVTIRATSGRPPVTAVLEGRLARSGAGTGVVRERTWIE